MRLLHVQTYQLKTFSEKHRPRYAILSHTWGKDEVLFEDVCYKGFSYWKDKEGALKICQCCRVAWKNGYKYVWIDTCCINRNDYDELSWSIKSMFKWYGEADVCYAHLEDAIAGQGMDRCKWFTRGWTLQELIAPKNMIFFDWKWSCMGNRLSLSSYLAKITGIDQKVLTRGHVIGSSRFKKHSVKAGSGLCATCGRCEWNPFRTGALSEFSVAQRMSWASNRETTRPEDIAYCLFGLFNVNLPLLYGEGKQAFQRLQEEIIRKHDDQSILAFSSWGRNLLASSPDEFWGCGKIHRSWEFDYSNNSRSIEFVNGILILNVLICPLPDYGRGVYLALLDCAMGTDLLSRPKIVLYKVSNSDKRSGGLCRLDRSQATESVDSSSGNRPIFERSRTRLGPLPRCE